MNNLLLNATPASREYLSIDTRNRTSNEIQCSEEDYKRLQGVLLFYLLPEELIDQNLEELIYNYQFYLEDLQLPEIKEEEEKRFTGIIMNEE